MTRLYQVNRKDKYKIIMGKDLFMECDNGGEIRIGINTDGLDITPINGVKMELCNYAGSPGIRFRSDGRKI